MIIYRITNLTNGKIYIGQTTKTLKRRWKGHCRSAASNSKKKTAIHGAIAKYGVDNFKIEEIHIASSIEELNILEELYIEKEQSLTPNGYNLKSGGFNNLYSDESKQKMSDAKMGTKLPQETKDKMSNTHKKRFQDKPELRQERSKRFTKAWQDPIYRANKSIKQKEYWRSEENRQRQSKIGKELSADPEYLKRVSDGVKASFRRPEVKNKLIAANERHQKAVVNDIGEIFNSIKDAAAHYNVFPSNIVKNIKGKQKTAAKRIWRYCKPKLIVIIGVSGSGKSWISNQLPVDKFHYVSYDKNKKKSPIEKLLKIEQGKIAVYDPTVNITGFLKQAEQQFDIELIAITGDFLTIKQQILNRGGRITKSLYSRWRRILALSKKAKFTGSSSEVLKYLKNST